MTRFVKITSLLSIIFFLTFLGLDIFRYSLFICVQYRLVIGITFIFFPILLSFLFKYIFRKNKKPHRLQWLAGSLNIFGLIYFFSLIHSVYINEYVPYTDISQQNGGKKVIKKYNSKYDFRHQNYLIEVYYPDNKIFSRGYRVHDTMNGHWQWWYENGKLRDEAYLDKGFYVRERKHWYDNGNLKQIEKIYGKCADNEDCCNGEVVYFRKDGSIDQKFKNGQVIDTVFIYYENGKLSIEECMKYDVRNGKYIDFYRNGSKQTEGNCLNDIKVGKWTYYDSLGKIDSMVEY